MSVGAKKSGMLSVLAPASGSDLRGLLTGSVQANLIGVPLLGLSVWVVVLILSGFVGLSTMSAAIAAPVYVAATQLPEGQPVFIYCLLMAAYIVYCHRSNIQRMREGTENRVTRAMLFGKRHA